MSMSKSNENKIRGALYGFAIGDAMGATTEFMTEEAIKKKYGRLDDIIGGGWLGLKAGDVTDDTQMMICVMDALQRSVEVGSGEDYFYELVGANFVEWLKGGPKDVGSQCSEGINYYIRYGERRGAKKDELGNGGLMRALPCALVEKMDLNLVQNSFTHYNSVCMDSVIRYHRLIRMALQRMMFVGKLSVNVQPTGCVTNTLINVEYWFRTSTSFEQAVVEAVNDGGDADTIAALTGGLAGAYYGFDEIPVKWVEKLNPEVKKYLDKFANFCCQKV